MTIERFWALLSCSIVHTQSNLDKKSNKALKKSNACKDPFFSARCSLLDWDPFCSRPKQSWSNFAINMGSMLPPCCLWGCFFLCHFHGMAINIFAHGGLLYFFQFIDSVVGRKQGFLNHEITRWLREFSWTLLPLLAPNTPSCEFSGVPAQRHCQMKLVWMRFSRRLMANALSLVCWWSWKWSAGKHCK